MRSLAGFLLHYVDFRFGRLLSGFRHYTEASARIRGALRVTPMAIETFFHLATAVSAFMAVFCFSAIGIVACTTETHRPPRLRNTGKRARQLRSNRRNAWR